MQRPDEMRRDDPAERMHLGERLPDEAEVAKSQVAQPAVDELRRCTRCARREVVALDENDPEPVPRRDLGDSGADDPAADDEQIEPFTAQALEGERALRHADHEADDTTRLPVSSRRALESTVVAAPQEPFEGDVQYQPSPALLPPPARVHGKAFDAGLVPARLSAIETQRLECLEIDHGSLLRFLCCASRAIRCRTGRSRRTEGTLERRWRPLEAGASVVGKAETNTEARTWSFASSAPSRFLTTQAASFTCEPPKSARSS